MAIGAFSSLVGELPSATLALIGVTCVLSALLAREYYSWYRLRQVPGPFLNSLSIYGMNKLAMSGKMSFILRDLGEKYGKRRLGSRPTRRAINSLTAARPTRPRWPQ